MSGLLNKKLIYKLVCWWVRDNNLYVVLEKWIGRKKKLNFLVEKIVVDKILNLLFFILSFFVCFY